MPFYPVLPLLFCASCAFMLWRSAVYALDQEPAIMPTIVEEDRPSEEGGAA